MMFDDDDDDDSDDAEDEETWQEWSGVEADGSGRENRGEVD